MFSASFSPDSRRVVTASWDGTARVWDAKDGHQIHLLQGFSARVTSASFSPDGKQVVTAEWERGTARVWDLSDAVPVATDLSGHVGAVTSASFSPDGTRVVTASADGTVIIYPVPVDDELRDHASRSVKRCLTTNQREELGLPPPSAGAAAFADRDRIDPPSSACLVSDRFGGVISAINMGFETMWTRTAAALATRERSSSQR
jgi:WD40 repeat protein